ncbi:copper homeostasis protein CutC [Vaginisenegalia massiliensis]|uniref:copper homeostasis protein CutC n=1 Tax=Vaginisenegalia massiliensis TaxID=2058294 RepID=UPI000F528A8A|nr:copper homeostasis protein CutC [Vaginisenegalia massiliensis]
MLLEVCAGSVNDCVIAQAAGAHRIELNAALPLGGLSPSAAIFLKARQHVQLPIICMVRPRPGGFCYDEIEQEVIFQEAQFFLENGADGIAFGFLTPRREVDSELTRQMIDLCHRYGKEAVFHRAIDCCSQLDQQVERLCQLGCDRLLTSGGHQTAYQGRQVLKRWQQDFGSRIQLCLAAGVRPHNLQALVQETGATQFHGSFKQGCFDPTTMGSHVNFACDSQYDYEQVASDQVRSVLSILDHVATNDSGKATGH